MYQNCIHFRQCYQSGAMCDDENFPINEDIAKPEDEPKRDRPKST